MDGCGTKQLSEPVTNIRYTIWCAPFCWKLMHAPPPVSSLLSLAGDACSVLENPQASENDRFVALELLKNANIASGMVLPGCQDTGTAIVMGKRGQVWIRAYFTYTYSYLLPSRFIYIFFILAPLPFMTSRKQAISLPIYVSATRVGSAPPHRVHFRPVFFSAGYDLTFRATETRYFSENRKK